MVKAWRAAAKVGETRYSLAELGWLQGYSGQTVDEILSYEGTDGIHNLLFALEEAIKAKVKAMGPLKITGVERMFAP